MTRQLCGQGQPQSRKPPKKAYRGKPRHVCLSPLTAFEVSEDSVDGGVRISFSFRVDVPFMTSVPVDRRVRILTPDEATGVSASKHTLRNMPIPLSGHIKSDCLPASSISDNLTELVR